MPIALYVVRVVCSIVLPISGTPYLTVLLTRITDLGADQTLLLFRPSTPFSLALLFRAVTLFRRLRPGFEILATGQTFSRCHDELRTFENAGIHDTFSVVPGAQRRNVQLSDTCFRAPDITVTCKPTGFQHI